MAELAHGMYSSAMQEIFFISRSLDASTLANCGAQTSSGAFEFGIASALSVKTRVHIIHLGHEDTQTVIANSLSVTSIKYRSLFGIARLLVVLRKKRTTPKPVIISTGYYLGEMAAILAVCVFSQFTAFGYVYDTHEPALKRMTWLKRILGHLYFGSGFFLVNRLSGLLVLNDAFIRKNGISTPYLKTRVGVSTHLRSTEKGVRSRRVGRRQVVVFAGTINRENGTDIILDFLEREPRCDLEFHFYGDGDCAARVVLHAETDSRIKYFGRIPEVLLLQKLSCADYLINLRDPNGISADFAFPSKLVNFMATGVPVISNVFPGLDCECAEHLIVIEYSAASLAKQVIALMQLDDTHSVGERAREYALRVGDWDGIADELLRFINFPSMARPSA